MPYMQLVTQLGVSMYLRKMQGFNTGIGRDGERSDSVQRLAD